MDEYQSLLNRLLVATTPNCIVPPSHPTTEFSGLALVGIAPADEEVSRGEIFVGPSGRILTKSLQIADIERSSVFLCNLCPVRIPSHGLSRSDIQVLRGPLLETLRKVQPRLVVTLGAEPTRALLNREAQIMLQRSHIYQIPELDCPVMPSIHPAYVLRQGLPLAALLINDLILARKTLAGEPRYRPWKYHLISDMSTLRDVLDRNIGQYMVLDSEATSKNPYTAQPFMISFAFLDNPDESYVVHIPTRDYRESLGPATLLDGTNHPTPREEVLPLMQEYDYPTIIFNLLYDYVLLSRFGYKPRVYVDPTYAYTLLDENSPKSAKVLGSFFSGIGPYTIDFHSTDLEVWKPYSACDAVNEARIWRALAPRFEDPTRKRLLFDYLMPLLRHLAEIGLRGCYVDLQSLDRVEVSMRTEIDSLARQMHAIVGYEFNHRSNAQLAEVFAKLRIPILGRTQKSGKPSFRKELLERLTESYPFVGLLRKIKSLEKLYSSYVKNIRIYLDEGRVHTNFDIKKTGRLSASEPALQTLPRDSVILELFAAPPGKILIKCDFSAAELRWMGFLAGEKKWLNPTLDLHVSNASFFYQVPVEQVTKEMRQEVKFLGFGKVYGSGIQTLAKQLKCSEDEAAALEKKFFETFPSIKNYMDGVREQALQQYTVTNYFGLERHFNYDLIFGGEEDRARCIREAYNFGPQSSTAIWTNKSLILIEECFRERIPECHVILQVHDAIIVEAPINQCKAAARIMWEIMRRPIDRKIGFFLPVDVSIGPNLLHQVKVVPFNAVDFDSAFDQSIQAYLEKCGGMDTVG